MVDTRFHPEINVGSPVSVQVSLDPHCASHQILGYLGSCES
jgi:hypothetical protein